jgi:hypothetical protein
VSLLGHRFEIRSSLSPEQAKAALRKQKRGWLDPKVGPRGWILGSFLCLQWSAVGDRGGPLVLARIADNGSASRVHGRAGLDVASLMMIGVILGILIFGTYEFVSKSSDPASLLLSCGVVLLVPGAVLGLRLLSLQDADPLVRFIGRVLQSPTALSTEVAPTQFDRTPVHSAKLNIDGRHLRVPPSADDVAHAILAMKPDTFLIIEFGSNIFMQTALKYDRFILEKCEGSDQVLYRAKGDFDRNDVIAMMTAYLRGSQSSERIVWETERG